MIDLIEYRLLRQLRSAFASPITFKSTSTGLVLTWRKLSPGTHLLVDPKTDARAIIRDTGAKAGRFAWKVLAAGEMHSVAEGRTDDLARAQSIAEAALHAYGENRGGARWISPSPG